MNLYEITYLKMYIGDSLRSDGIDVKDSDVNIYSHTPEYDEGYHYFHTIYNIGENKGDTELMEIYYTDLVIFLMSRKPCECE